MTAIVTMHEVISGSTFADEPLVLAFYAQKNFP
jgi:hypothetical protein